VTKATDNVITLLPFIFSREFDLWIYYWMYIKWQWHTANVYEWQLVSWPFCQLRVQWDIALSSIHISLYQQVVINRVHRMRFSTLPWHVTHHCMTLYDMHLVDGHSWTASIEHCRTHHFPLMTYVSVPLR
jgi:hypothetical protein